MPKINKRILLEKQIHICKYQQKHGKKIFTMKIYLPETAKAIKKIFMKLFNYFFVDLPQNEE